MRFSNERKVLLIGLDAAGKTTTLYQLFANKRVNTVPTRGHNHERLEWGGYTLDLWDVGGQDALRSHWRHHYTVSY